MSATICWRRNNVSVITSAQHLDDRAIEWIASGWKAFDPLALHMGATGNRRADL